MLHDCLHEIPLDRLRGASSATDAGIPRKQILYSFWAFSRLISQVYPIILPSRL